MSIKFECPHCQVKLKIPDALAGKKCRCVTCKQAFVVPGTPPAAPVDVAAAPRPTPPNPATPRPAPARAPVAAKGGDGAVGAIDKRPPVVRKVPDKLPPPAPVPIKAPNLPAEDVEALAAAAFADKPPEPEVVVNETIKFECEYCGFALEVPAEQGGKRIQCSDCRRITRVPEAVKREAKEWHRAAQTQAEETAAAAAKEGAWGTANIKASDTKALVEAGILEKETEPLTRMQLITWWSLRGLGGAAVLTLLVVGVVQLMSWWSGRKQERLFKEAFAAAAEDKVSPEGQAVLHIAAGDYRRRQRRPGDGKTGGSATEARTQFTEAYRLLAADTSATLSPERLADRDFALTRLAMAEIELGGEGDEVTQGQREKWDDVQRSLRASLTAIASPEARAMALRAVCRRLLARKQGKRALGLAQQVTEPTGAAREDRFDKAEILARVGLEFLNKDRPLAEEVARHLTGFGAKAGDPPPPQPAVVALLTTLSKTVPAPPDTFVPPLHKDKMTPDEEAQADREREAVAIGEIEALARLGRVDEARRRAGLPMEEIARLRALVGLAEATSDRTDIDTACKFAAGLRAFAEKLSDNRFLLEDQQHQQNLARVRLNWALLRLIDLAAGAGVESDVLNGVAAVISPDLRNRGQFMVFRGKLKGAKAPVEEAVADAVDAKTLGRALARLELARVNTRQSSSYADKAAAWTEGMRSFGMIGALLGLQGGSDSEEP